MLHTECCVLVILHSSLKIAPSLWLLVVASLWRSTLYFCRRGGCSSFIDICRWLFQMQGIVVAMFFSCSSISGFTGPVCNSIVFCFQYCLLLASSWNSKFFCWPFSWLFSLNEWQWSWFEFLHLESNGLIDLWACFQCSSYYP